MPAVKDVGEPCEGKPHARFDGGREETNASRPTPCGARRLPPTRPLPRLIGAGLRVRCVVCAVVVVEPVWQCGGALSDSSLRRAAKCRKKLVRTPQRRR